MKYDLIVFLVSLIVYGTLINCLSLRKTLIMDTPANHTSLNGTDNNGTNATNITVKVITEEERKKNIESKIREIKNKIQKQREHDEEIKANQEREKMIQKMQKISQDLQQIFTEIKKNKIISDKINKEYQSQKDFKKIVHEINSSENNEYKYMYYKLLNSYKKLTENFNNKILNAYMSIISAREKQISLIDEISSIEEYKEKIGHVNRNANTTNENNVDILIKKKNCILHNTESECKADENCRWNAIVNKCSYKQ